MADAQHPTGPQAGHGKDNLLPGVKYVIAVSSGKGGVGKSTVSVNLAVAMAQTGAKVGLLDADIYGPNIPMMMGVSKPPDQIDGKIAPAESHGVKLISMGFFVPEDTAVVWRGPMVHTAIQQLFRDVLWGELDYLLIDLPPGTGDAQLTLTQLVPLTGAITVTTPQEVALHDVRKGMMMFQKVNVPLLGIVENMSYFLCGHCGERTEIFSHGGGERAAAKLGVPFLGRVPIDPAIREAAIGQSDRDGRPCLSTVGSIQGHRKKIIAGVSGATKDVPPIESLLSKIKNPFAKT
jgi:ATPases involved in chromosome partitioning